MQSRPKDLHGYIKIYQIFWKRHCICLTKRDAIIVSEWLQSEKISALPYFSGIKNDGEDTNEYGFTWKISCATMKLKL